MKRTKPGFTLVELLVVISIIGILMSLLIPAVNAARETARRNTCATNMKNFALATVQYENTKRSLPPWVDKYGFFDPSGTGAGGVDPSDLNNYSGTVPAHVKVGGYGVSLLPWLDAQPTYEHWTQDRYPVISDGNGDLEASSGLSGTGFHELAAPNLAIFQCPSNPVSEGTHGLNSYVPNNGMSHLYTTSAHTQAAPGTPVAAFLDSQSKANGCFTAKYRGLDTSATPKLLPVAQPVRLDDLKDGQGFTVLLSENVQAAPWHRPGFLNDSNLVVAAGTQDIVETPALVYSRYSNGMVWHYEDDRATELNSLSPPPVSPLGVSVQEVFRQHRINGGGNTVSEDRFTLTMDANVWDSPSLARPSSAHVDGVNCAFADGQTRFVGDNIDYRVYQALLTPRGKSSDVPWKEFVLTDELGAQ